MTSDLLLPADMTERERRAWQAWNETADREIERQRRASWADVPVLATEMRSEIRARISQFMGD